MCLKDTWYELNGGGGCLNPVAHTIFCVVVMLVSLACMVRGTMALPYLVVRARWILSLFIGVQVFIFLTELFGLVFLVTDSNSLLILRLFLLNVFAFGACVGSLTRTQFFLETIAGTHQYSGRSLTILKHILMVCLTLHSVLVPTGLMILSTTLPTHYQREVALQTSMAVASSIYFVALIPTAVVAYRLLAVMRTVIELGHSPSHVAIAKENIELLRKGMVKTLAGIAGAAVGLTFCAIFGLRWFLVHLAFVANQIGCIGAISYLKTCRIDHRLSKHKHNKGEKERSRPHNIGNGNENGNENGNGTGNGNGTANGNGNMKMPGRSIRSERQGLNSHNGAEGEGEGEGEAAHGPSHDHSNHPSVVTVVTNEGRPSIDHHHPADAMSVGTDPTTTTTGATTDQMSRMNISGGTDRSTNEEAMAIR